MSGVRAIEYAIYSSPVSFLLLLFCFFFFKSTKTMLLPAFRSKHTDTTIRRVQCSRVEQVRTTSIFFSHSLDRFASYFASVQFHIDIERDFNLLLKWN